MSEGVLFKGEKVIIPSSMRTEMLKCIHSSHLGIEKCKRRARDVLFWPGMNSRIQDVVSNCSICNRYQRRNTKEPLLSHETPQRPWSRVVADMFELNGKSYLTLVDYYSGFIEVNLIHDTTSKQVITYCKSQFARHGIPDILITDNGPQFSSTAFKEFARQYVFKHCTTSPHYPQANGMAEKAVQTAKNLIKKAIADKRDPYLALLEHRNTPLSDQLGSPVQQLMGRRTRTLIPTSEKLLQPKVISPKVVYKEITQRKAKQKYYYDRHARHLKEMPVGDAVMMLDGNKWKPAKMIAISQEAPRSYVIKTPEGQTYRRNRRHLKGAPNNSTKASLTTDEDYLSDGCCTDNDDITNDTSANETNADDIQPSQSTPPVVTLRRSQRTIRQPEDTATQIIDFMCIRNITS